MEDIVKFMFEHFRSEQAFDKIMKNNFNKLYELILRFKDIIDNVYLSSLRNEIFTGVKKEEKNNIIENNANNLNINLEHNIKIFVLYVMKNI